MSQTISFDYFYGGQSDAFSYYRIPRLLITGHQFKGLSTDAKLLYGLLLDRMGLSSRNGWYDELGRVYIYYPLDEIQGDLNCGHDKAVKLLAELDTGKGIGLIERVKQGQGRPAKIYVKQFTTTEIPQPPAPPLESEEPNPRLPKSGSQDCGISEVLTAEKPTSRLPKNRSADFGKADGSYNIPQEGEGFSIRLHPDYFFDFLDHPFTVNREVDDYKELFDSIKANGINEPVKARPREGGGLELISGHRRHDIAKQLNYPVPVIIEQVDTNDAQIECVDGNLHRQDIPTSELARAAKMKMEALARKAGRRSKMDQLTGPSKRTDQIVAEDNSMVDAYSWVTAPYPSYALSNNNQEIHRVQERIKQLERNRDVGFQGWEFAGGKVVANAEMNRLQIFFDEIPPAETRKELKSRGFRWARSEGAWQHQLTRDAIYAASRIPAICPTDGTDPRKLQPTAKSKSTPER